MSIITKDRARSMLNSYLLYKNDIKNIDLEIEELKNNYSLNGISLNERSGPTNKISSITETRIVNKDDKIKELENLKRFHEVKCEKIENAVNILKEFERQVIELKYMIPPVKSWYTVSKEIGFTTIACQRAEDRAIKKMLPLLFK